MQPGRHVTEDLSGKRHGRLGLRDAQFREADGDFAGATFRLHLARHPLQSRGASGVHAQPLRLAAIDTHFSRPIRNAESPTVRIPF